MQRIDGRFVFAASDLNNYLECAHLTLLDRRVALGDLHKPSQDDASRALIARKGDEHERRHLAELQDRHPGGVTSLDRPDHTIEALAAAAGATVSAMERGDRLIYQATFFDGVFLGHPDFLRRIEVPCARWAWSYEVIDAKLALHTKPYFLLQICNYSEHLANVQGSMPEYAYIVLGNGEERRYKLADYLAYYRRVKQRFLDSVCDADPAAAAYPDKCEHCKTCKWSDRCEAQRRTDDHLSLVAWMRRDQIAKLGSNGVPTVTSLATAREDQRPAGMIPETFAKLRRQAWLQVRGRTEGPLYELLEHEPWEGFGQMPRPAKGDVFFDMEGDPLYEPARGLEYLFGCWLPDDEPQYKAFRALSRSEEKVAFEQFVDFIIDRRRVYPDLHVYHYADYEKSALRRLAQLHATREREVDDLLRGEVLVDLFAVVRQSLAISEESYSIKRLEKFYAFQRATEVKKGDESIVMFERWLAEPQRLEILQDIERYNEDDCRSTLLLRDWLLERRSEAMAKRGIDIPFHAPKVQCHAEPVDGCRKCADRVKQERENAQTTDLQRKLLDGVLTPQSEAEYAAMGQEQQARYLLGHVLAYHRREEKPVWWAFFDRCENADTLVEFDKDAIGGLRLCDDVEAGKDKRSTLYAFAFPEQHYKLGPGDNAADPATAKPVTIHAIDPDVNRITLKSTCSPEAARGIHAVIPGGPLATNEQKAALVRVAQSYAGGTLHGATRDLLLAHDPRAIGMTTLQPANLTPEAVSAAARALDGSYLFVQGPPGSGKSTTGSRVICDLLAAGKRVGVMSTGHKAIHHLLHKVEECAHERGSPFVGLYKYTKGNGDSEFISNLNEPYITSHATNEPFESGGFQLAAGTAWLFARAELEGAFDYLFIDEAGQVSLADALAVSTAAKNVVLLGDPSQLAQVSQGAHPLHAGDSILQHLLRGETTVPEHRGIFLNESYRMHPEICRFVSRTMYSGRLCAASKAGNQRITAPGISGGGLRYLPVEHRGNSRESVEEAECIARHIAQLLQGTVTDEDCATRAMRPSDIIVVTPYNAQRRLVRRALAEAEIDVRVGTVDKFQGQEAFVVFYSMATSSGADIPRDVDFLFEPNRFNVAISRARALSVLVCSPRLLDVRCANTGQMAAVNLLCAFVEDTFAGAAAVL